MKPFKTLFQKSSSPLLLSLLNNFESSLIERLENLIPENKAEILTLPWMILAMESLYDTHNDINTLITDLNLHDLDHQYCVDVYMDLTKMLLDLCNAFTSQLHHTNHCIFGLKFLRDDLELESEEQCNEIRSILDTWRQEIREKKYSEIDTILGEFVESLNFCKVKNFEKGKVFMKAIYAANVFTVYIFSVFATVLSDSDRSSSLEISVSKKQSWWKNAFVDLQSIVNGEIRDALSSSDGTMILEELECVDAKVKKLDLLVQDGDDLVQECYEELKEEVEKLDNGIDELSGKIQNLFSVTMEGRNSILPNL